jgi:hypothetical protein
MDLIFLQTELDAMRKLPSMTLAAGILVLDISAAE